MTKENTTNPIKKDVLTKKMKGFIEIFVLNAGRVYITCEKFGIHATTYYAWFKKSEKFKKAIETAIETFKDKVEGKIVSHLNSEDKRISADMCKFYAKTKMKERGYVEKQELEYSTGEGLKINVNISEDVKKLFEEK